MVDFKSCFYVHPSCEILSLNIDFIGLPELMKVCFELVYGRSQEITHSFLFAKFYVPC